MLKDFEVNFKVCSYQLLMFCSCVESYLQSTYWPRVCDLSGGLDEPVKKKPRYTQVCHINCFHFFDNLLCNVHKDFLPLTEY